MANNSVINLGELSKPATILIEKISDAVGGIFKPCQIIRIAKAEAKASLIKANSDIEIKEITQRAMNRFIEEETKKQLNMENIIQKAFPTLNENANPNEIDNDWITNFFDKCRLISDQEMQELWSKILSSEANKPNTYYKRTVNLLSSLDKNDAILFTKFCQFNWNIDNEFIPLIFDTNNEIYTKENISFGTLTHLKNIGLINYSSFGYGINFDKEINVTYKYKKLKIIFRKKNNKISAGQALLTQAGQELAPICNFKQNNEFYDYALKQLGKEKIFGLIKLIKKINYEQ